MKKGFSGFNLCCSVTEVKIPVLTLVLAYDILFDSVNVVYVIEGLSNKNRMSLRSSSVVPYCELMECYKRFVIYI